MLLLFNSLLLVLWLSLLSDKSDNGVVDGDGGDVPFCVIVVVVVEFDNVVFVCVLDGVVDVSCSFNVLTSFSANVALWGEEEKRIDMSFCVSNWNYYNLIKLHQVISFL